MIGKTTTQEALAFFFTSPTQPIHLRELSRQLGRSMPAILSAVKALQKEGLVHIERGTALTIVKANLSNPAFRHAKKVHNLQSLYDSGLVDVLEKTASHPQAVVCFGSYARGEDTEQSDIDIAVIGGRESSVSIEPFEKKLKRSISLHFLDTNRLSGPFKSNLSNGIVLEGAV